MSDTSPVGSDLPPFPKPKPEETFIHYINGFCKQDRDPDYFRIYPDILSTRYYIIVRRDDAVHGDVIVWSAADMAAAGIQPQGEVPYCSIGLKFETVVQFVMISNETVGSLATKALIGQTVQAMRAGGSRVASRLATERHDEPGGPGGAGEGEHATLPTIGPGSY